MCCVLEFFFPTPTAGEIIAMLVPLGILATPHEDRGEDCTCCIYEEPPSHKLYRSSLCSISIAARKEHKITINAHSYLLQKGLLYPAPKSQED